MPRRSSLSLERLSLRAYLTVFIVIIIIAVAAFLTTVSYVSTRDQLITQNENLQAYIEENVLESVKLVDTGLRLYDSTLNRQMQDAFPLYLDAYDASGGDIAAINLTALKSTLQPGFSGTLDLYAINESGVIVASTVPAVMGLDFQQYPDYYQSITRLREGSSFAADRVVRSIPSTEEGTVTGTLRKFAYFPTPDHRYLLEMGLESDAFFQERTDLSYATIAERTLQLDPNLVSVRIVDTNRVLVSVPTGTNGTLVEDPGIDRALATRQTFSVADPAGGTVTTYLFADLKDPAAASDPSLVIEMVNSGALLEAELHQILVLHFLVALIAVGMGVVLAYGTARMLTRPIREIIEDVDTIARGDLDHPIRGMENPEFTMLENSITIMIQRIREYSEALEREKAELRIASHIQLSFLPRKVPRIEGFDIAAVSTPAREVGGDFYDIIDLGKERTGLVIADVAGKGVPAALFMVLSRTTVRTSARMKEPVAAAVTDANRMISADADQGMFVTLVLGILDHRAREFTYGNAGHNPPLHYRDSTGEIIPLSPTGMALGVDEDAIYTQAAVTLDPGDLLVFYTDGVVEAEDAAHGQFGEDRLVAVIRQHHDLTAAGVLAKIQEAIGEFIAGAPQYDDLTILVLRATPKPE
ncbi:serine phosphatase RsbU (regulator of sigma subunit) [Methanolinea mesophila]|uniref:PP2C family protein-serine/threonine phosphatase n=1 Tax=Methanolinea mesophila TaxID=547055 RepID=UPI001AE65E07|nr:PP2C family protein-serine/threonine phosphatase [Methanolinea mesophila]MBP1928865.1 serine phosphatase RsbU (regulator of sigma subunit) [Methanolinea mesophila]